MTRIWRWVNRLWDRHINEFACLFTALTLIFGLIAVIQRFELYDRHLGLDWGTVPDWLAGASSLIAIGALTVAVWEWRSGQVERRDREADQARLVIVELAKPEPVSAYEDPNQLRSQRLLAKNHSTSPVFNLQVNSMEDCDQDVLVWEDPVSRRSAFSTPSLYPVLATGEGTRTMFVAGSYEGRTDIETIEFTFTDAVGQDWRRVGNRPPVRLRR